MGYCSDWRAAVCGPPERVDACLQRLRARLLETETSADQIKAFHDMAPSEREYSGEDVVGSNPLKLVAWGYDKDYCSEGWTNLMSLIQQLAADHELDFCLARVGEDDDVEIVNGKDIHVVVHHRLAGVEWPGGKRATTPNDLVEIFIHQVLAEPVILSSAEHRALLSQASQRLLRCAVSEMLQDAEDAEDV